MRVNFSLDGNAKDSSSTTRAKSAKVKGSSGTRSVRIANAKDSSIVKSATAKDSSGAKSVKIANLETSEQRGCQKEFILCSEFLWEV